MRVYNIGGLTFQVFDEYCFTDEQNVIKAIRPANGATSFQINADTYYFGRQGTVIIDYSEIVKSVNGGEIDITVGPNSRNIEFFTTPGIAPDYSGYFPPQKLVVLSNSGIDRCYISWYWPQVTSLQGLVGSTWINLFTTSIDGRPNSQYDLETIGYNRYRIISGSNVLWESNAPTFLTNCEEHRIIYLEWMGENGLKKSYVFDRISDIRKVGTKIELSAFNNNGYSTLKNKNKDIKVVATDLMPNDYDYIADIVYSSEVYLYDYNHIEQRVTIAQDSLDTEWINTRRNLSLTINYKKYVSI